MERICIVIPPKIKATHTYTPYTDTHRHKYQETVCENNNTNKQITEKMPIRNSMVVIFGCYAMYRVYIVHILENMENGIFEHTFCKGSIRVRKSGWIE